MNFKRIIFLALGITVSMQILAQDNSVGINTNVPNSNAVLDLVSPGDDQGFLVPRLSSDDRIAMNFTLSNDENGLMVFNTDEGIFYYWKNGRWLQGLGILNSLVFPTFVIHFCVTPSDFNSFFSNFIFFNSLIDF